jgi:hypothetical protein
MLLNIIVDMLAIIIVCKNLGQIVGIVSHLVYGGLSILQYTDDTIPFMNMT